VTGTLAPNLRDLKPVADAGTDKNRDQLRSNDPAHLVGALAYDGLREASHLEPNPEQCAEYYRAIATNKQGA
jgi:hypothetical protein